MEIAPLSAAAYARPTASTARIEKTARDFEAMVIAQFMAPLFNSVETPGIAGGGAGEKAFGSLLQEEYANAIAERGGFGIADQIKAALIDIQSRRPG